MKQKAASFSLLLSCCVLALSPFSAQADTLSAAENASMFGRLNQNLIPTIGSMACGPSSAVNALVFLQNAYSGLYGTSLVPDSNLNGALDTADLIAVAQVLASPSYMNTTLTNGTYWTYFESGIRKYIEQAVPGVTKYSDRYFSGDPASWSFLYQNLLSHNSMEILIQKTAPNSGANHFLTVYGINWNDLTLSGSLSYVDPWTGMTGTTAMWYDNGTHRYDLAYGGTSWIYGGSVETPVPEPAGFVLLGSILGLFLVSRRKRLSA